MMRMLIVLFVLYLTSCATLYRPDVHLKPNSVNLYLLRLYTGARGSCLYEDNFIRQAKEVCPNGYLILEKTYKPTFFPIKESDTHFNWVIECNVD